MSKQSNDSNPHMNGCYEKREAHLRLFLNVESSLSYLLHQWYFTRVMETRGTIY